MNANEDSNENSQNDDELPPDMAEENAIAQDVASPARTNPTQAAAELGMIRIPAKLRQLKILGEQADFTGCAGPIYKGAALLSLQNAREIKERLKQKILKEEDSIAAAALSGAYASLMKSEAAYIKAVNEAIPANSKTAAKGRRTFAKGQMMGPPIDVKST